MDGTCSDQHKANSDRQHRRKRKRKQKGVDFLSAKRQNSTDNIGINNLPDDVLIAILSCMSLKEAVRTSVLSRRWRYLWMFTSGTLEFDDRDTATGPKMKREKFKAWVNRVLKLHQGPSLDSLIIRFTSLCLRARSGDRSGDIDRWIYFAMQKEVKRFELNLSVLGRYHSYYEFPKVEKLLSRSHEVKFAFGFLRSLRLVDVDIKDEVVQYFLASCLYLEQLCISASFVTKNLQVVDPLPNLKVLEISECLNIQSLEISAMSLVSFTYEGNEISLPFKKIPNLSELTLGGNFCKSFIYEPNKHSSYSVQLVKLALNLRIAIPERAIIAPPALPQLFSLKRLELNIVSKVGRSLRFFTSLIKASPFLNEFRIKISYMVQAPWDMISLMQFPEVSAAMAPLFYRFYHKNLKTVEMAGYIGCSSDNNFLLQLFKIAPSLETVVIDTRSEYYEQELGDCYTMCTMKKVEGVPCICKKQEIGARTRMEAKKRAKYLESCISRETILVIT